MDDTKLPGLMDISSEDILNFNSNNENITNLNPELHDFDGVFVNQYDVNEYCFTMPMENGRIVDLNFPHSPEKDKEDTCTTGSVKSSPTGIIPCQDEFGGSLNFEVILDSRAHQYRQKWNYSVTLQKLFIDIDKVLLLNFKCDYEKVITNVPLFIRAMPMYSAADWLKDSVDRCFQHLSPIDKLNKGVTHIEHIIRCDNDETTYHKDEISNRKSVVTRLSRPEHGSDSTRLSYRFVCKTSCVGGMQRRPIIVIFTLEDYTGQVLGRRALPVKICSCPKRDMDREEKDTKLEKNTVFRRNKRCISQENPQNHKHHHQHNSNNLPPSKAIKLETSSTESEVESINYSLPFNYGTNTKKHYKLVLEAICSTIIGVSEVHNIKDTQALIEDLKTRLNNLD